MSHKKFDRHELFNNELMKYHSDTITKVRDWTMDNMSKIHTPLYNMLCGIWDGYLYDSLLDEAKSMKLPSNLIERLEYTIEKIETDIKSNGERVTQV